MATWVLSGQSNAVGLAPYVGPYATIRSVSQGSVGIAAWDAGQPLWVALEAALRAGPVDAFLWWQGENNTDDPDGYPTKLDDLMRRVQAVVGRQKLLTAVIIGVSAAGPLGGLEGWDTFRAMQATYAAARGFYYVRCDDIDPKPVIGSYDPPSGGTWAGPTSSPHLTSAGYVQVASRVATVLA